MSISNSCFVSRDTETDFKALAKHQRFLNMESLLLHGIALFCATRAFLLCIYLRHHPLHWLRLQTRALFIGLCQCSYIFVSCPAFMLQVTWKKSIVVSVLSNTIART